MNGAQAELVLHPGEWYFGTGYSRLRTLLGSCVAITVWHPVLRCGGMCHFLLPRPPTNINDNRPDARYGTHALHFLRSAMEIRAPLPDYQFGCFGGSDMFLDQARTRVGQSNIELVQQWLHRYHIEPIHESLGGNNSRSVILELNSGRIDLKQVNMQSKAGASSDDQRARR